jgi:hypothetical protein
MYHKRLNWLWFFAQGKKMTKSLSWLWFFAQGEKDPAYSIQSGSKVAHYIQVVQKCYL